MRLTPEKLAKSTIVLHSYQSLDQCKSLKVEGRCDDGSMHCPEVDPGFEIGMCAKISVPHSLFKSTTTFGHLGNNVES